MRIVAVYFMITVAMHLTHCAIFPGTALYKHITAINGGTYNKYDPRIRCWRLYHAHNTTSFCTENDVAQLLLKARIKQMNMHMIQSRRLERECALQHCTAPCNHQKKIDHIYQTILPRIYLLACDSIMRPVMARWSLFMENQNSEKYFPLAQLCICAGLNSAAQLHCGIIRSHDNEYYYPIIYVNTPSKDNSLLSSSVILPTESFYAEMLFVLAHEFGHSLGEISIQMPIIDYMNQHSEHEADLQAMRLIGKATALDGAVLFFSKLHLCNAIQRQIDRQALHKVYGNGLLFLFKHSLDLLKEQYGTHPDSLDRMNLCITTAADCELVEKFQPQEISDEVYELCYRLLRRKTIQCATQARYNIECALGMDAQKYPFDVHESITRAYQEIVHTIDQSVRTSMKIWEPKNTKFSCLKIGNFSPPLGDVAKLLSSMNQA